MVPTFMHSSNTTDEITYSRNKSKSSSLCNAEPHIIMCVSGSKLKRNNTKPLIYKLKTFSVWIVCVFHNLKTEIRQEFYEQKKRKKT